MLRSVLELNCRRVEYSGSFSLVRSIYFDDFQMSAYRESLDFVTKYTSIRAGLESLVDAETTIRALQKFHDIEDEVHLQEVFRKASGPRATFGRLIVRSLH